MEDKSTSQNEAPLAAILEQLVTLNKALVQTMHHMAGTSAPVGNNNNNNNIHEGASDNQTPPATVESMMRDVEQRDPPSFTGMGGPTELNNWITEMNSIFLSLGCPLWLRVRIGAKYLTGYANSWWQGIQEGFFEPYTKVASTGGTVRLEKDWEDFTALLENEFYPECIKLAKRIEFKELRQMDGESISDFYTKFIELCRFAKETLPTEESKAISFKEKLLEKVRNNLGSEDSETFEDVYARAVAVEGNTLSMESGIKRKRNEGASNVNGNPLKKRNFNQSKGKNKLLRNARGTQKQTQSHSRERNYFCKRCKGNHPGADCKGEPVECHHCRKLGHRVFECRAKLAGKPPVVLAGGLTNGVGLSDPGVHGIRIGITDPTYRNLALTKGVTTTAPGLVSSAVEATSSKVTTGQPQILDQVGTGNDCVTSGNLL